jgi:hypothetical protein
VVAAYFPACPRQCIEALVKVSHSGGLKYVLGAKVISANACERARVCSIEDFSDLLDLVLCSHSA